ncbi:MAG: hypothetical protein LBP65_04340 [Puniceicoccales bacterium]|jgi:hypothetical protein|nr:hypothetical protein [Puniceicoccales bacterium]
MSQRPIQRQTFRLSQRQRLDLHILSLSWGELSTLLPPPDGASADLAAAAVPPRTALLHQLALESIGERELLEAIVDGLGPTGFLEETPKNLAKLLKISVADVDRVRMRLMEWEERGMGSLNFREFFLWHTRRHAPEDLLQRARIALLAKPSCQNFLPALRLFRRKFGAEAFCTLLPRFATGQLASHPRIDGLNWDGDGPIGPPDLRLWPGESAGWNVTLPGGDFWKKERLEPGLALAMERRDSMLRQIGQWFVERQKNFLHDGPFGLVPMSQRQLADWGGWAQSTVSRALRHKYLQTPAGTWPFCELFSQKGEPPTALLRDRLTALIIERPEALIWSDRRIGEALSLLWGIRTDRRQIGSLRRRAAKTSRQSKSS